MIPPNAMAVGQPVVSSSYFGEASFEDRFTSFDPSKYSDKTWPTDIGLQGQWHENWVANNETQKYVAQDDLPPDSWSPFTITADGLRIRAEEIPSGADHLEWSLMKKYDPNGDGSLKMTTDYPGWPNISVPWLPHTPVQGVDYLLEPYQGDFRVLWLKYAQRWRSGILNTRDDKASLNQGMLWFVAKLPKGGENDQSGNRSYRHRSTAFPALWVYQQIRRNRGRNNEPRTPGLYQYNTDGTLDEIDLIEQGSFNPDKLYHAMHLHTGERMDFIYNFKELGDATFTDTGLDPSENFYIYILHVAPEQTGFALAPLGEIPKYVRVNTTRRAFYETRRTVLLDPADDRKLVLNGNNAPIFTGEQFYDNGSPRLPDMQVLLNLAMDGNWLLDLMRDTVPPPYGTLGDGRKYCDMTVKSWGINPLVGAKFRRPDGEIYMPHQSITPIATNPWDGTAASALPLSTISGYSGG